MTKSTVLEDLSHHLNDIKKKNLDFYEKDLKDILLQHFTYVTEQLTVLIEKCKKTNLNEKLLKLLLLQERVNYEKENPTTIDTLNYLKLCTIIDTELSKLSD